MSDDLVKRYRQLQEVIGGCHDGYCVVRKPKGMHTNGGCNCLEDLRLHERSRIGHLLRCAQGMADRIEELEAKLAKAVEGLENVSRLVDNQYADRLYTQTVAGWEQCADDVKDVARTTLAELTGGEDE